MTATTPNPVRHFAATGVAGWRIGRDGAIYGVTLKGAYKLQ